MGCSPAARLIFKTAAHNWRAGPDRIQIMLTVWVVRVDVYVCLNVEQVVKYLLWALTVYRDTYPKSTVERSVGDY